MRLAELVDTIIDDSLTLCICCYIWSSECCLTFTAAVPPEVSPSDGMTSKTANLGDPVTISFTVVNAPAVNVTKEGIQWMFTGSNGTVNVSCTNTLKYTFSDDCLNLTVNNTAASDAGRYQITLTTDTGTGTSAVALSVSGGM